MDKLLNLSDEEMIAEGFLIIERRHNSISYIPTETYKIAMSNPIPTECPFSTKLLKVVSSSRATRSNFWGAETLRN